MNEKFNDKGEIRCLHCPHFNSDNLVCPKRLAKLPCPMKESAGAEKEA